MKNIHYAIAFAIMTIASPAMASTVTIHVEGLASDKGTVYAGLCTEAGWENLKCRTVKLEPTTQTLIHHWEDVPPGEYGVTLRHDENDNQKMDFNFFGAPVEQWGASNNPAPRMGRSLWKDVVFKHGEQSQTLKIKMQPEVD